MAAELPYVRDGVPCTGCGAHVRRGAGWCSQCFQPGPVVAAGPVAVFEPAPGPVERAVAAPVRAVRDEASAGWPCGVCGAANGFDRTVCTCGARFLAGLSEHAPTLSLPVVGDLAAMSSGRRYALSAAVALVLALLVVLVLDAVGALL